MFRSDLQCDVRSLTYDFKTRIGTLEMPPDNCCDMLGCIHLFERIDVEVKRIDTFAGSIPDTSYKLSTKGWVAIMAEE